MSLTPTELTALKNDILANTDPVVVQAVSDVATNVIADWYNQDASPDHWIYRKEVSTEEISDAIDLQDMADITATDSDRVIKLFEVRSLADAGCFCGENARTRSAWDDVFSAAAGDNSQQAIATLWTRLATYAEQVQSLATGTGADAANADTTSWQGALSASDIRDALNS